MKRGTLACVMVAVLALAGCTGSRVEDIAVPTGTDAPERGPNWSFTDIDGIRQSRDKALGEPSLLFFMATWCPSCRSTAPTLAQIRSEYAERGLDLYTLSWDPAEDESDLRKWKQERNQEWPHGIDSGSAIAKTFGVTRQSSLVILDADGFMTKRYTYASPSAAELRAALEAAYGN